MITIPKFTLILFTLPDGRIALQRRTKDAPYGAGLLGIFGGEIEEGETPEEGLFREIEEETSIDIPSLHSTFVQDFIMKASEDFAQDRQFYLYKGLIGNMDFEVYEGDGAEAFSLDEIKRRNDLTGSAQYTFDKILKI